MTYLCNLLKIYRCTQKWDRQKIFLKKKGSKIPTKKIQIENWFCLIKFVFLLILIRQLQVHKIRAPPKGTWSDSDKTWWAVDLCWSTPDSLSLKGGKKLYRNISSCTHATSLYQLKNQYHFTFGHCVQNVSTARARAHRNRVTRHKITI
jgi:hypothetical protein